MYLKSLGIAGTEAHLRSILATVPDAMIIIDEKGFILSFSAAAEKMFGYTEDEVIGENVSMLMPSPDRERHDGYLQHYVDTGQRKIMVSGESPLLVIATATASPSSCRLVRLGWTASACSRGSFTTSRNVSASS